MITKKRQELEQFIKEQMVGPGGCGVNFFNGIVEEDKIPKSPLEYNNEVINSTPGSFYSTGILFPEENPIKDNNNKSDVEKKTQLDDYVDEDNNDDEPANLNSIDSDDISSLSQRFPNSIGLSFCLSENLTDDNIAELKVEVSGRYYKKIENKHLINISVRINNLEIFSAFYEKHKDLFSQYFKYQNGFLFPKAIKKEDFKIIKDLINDIDKKIAKDIFGEEYYGINNDGTYLSEDKKKDIIQKIEQIEQNENLLSYFFDILDLYKRGSFGVWECNPFSKKINLSEISLELEDGEIKKIYSPKNTESFREIIRYDVKTKKKEKDAVASLSLHAQLTKDTRDSSNKSKYLKLQLVNTSTKIIFNDGEYYSIVNEKVNGRAFFGVEIKVTSKHIAEYSNRLENEDDTESKELNYIYRQYKDYGIGHFCSVDWGTNSDGVRFVKTEFIPQNELPDIEPSPQNKLEWVEKDDSSDLFVPKPYFENTEFMQFKWLSTFSTVTVTDEDIKKGLLKFVEAYGKWINSLENENDITSEIIKKCNIDYDRIKENINELLSDNDKMLSFRIMNSAMFMQLWHSKKSGSNDLTELMNTNDFSFNTKFYEKASDKLFDKTNSASWRPFQLAFILLNLDGIYQKENDPKWEARNELVDLVWFPTGGGKTEAYLGIIALTIINRRRSNKTGSGGTTAIMRYTLRLLATQQFQRATRVIMALDLIRFWEIDGYNLGNDAIDIGLYVGGDALPNNLDDLVDECQKAQANGFANSKIPISQCPWCGTKFEGKPFYSDDDNMLRLFCPNRKCSFTNNRRVDNYIPVNLSDEQIYEHPPTLLFGTVDKFAQLAHTNNTKKDSRKLFGYDNIEARRNLSPDLIIQDELHLLLGPLGSAVSLFESAIDQLCSRTITVDGEDLIIRPKIISSTATTRNAPLQIRALYDRSVNIFPKTGVDSDDSFFAFYKREFNSKNQSDYISKRKYIGIMPMGRTQMTLQIRLAAIFFVHRAIFEKRYQNTQDKKGFEKAMDYYFTLISYFNSLREVGKTDAQFHTEFNKYTRRLFKRVARQGNMAECFYSYDSAFNKSELTGRLKGAEVVNELAKVERKWTPELRLPHKKDSGETFESAVLPPDFVIATNMISVGIDVSRFSTIIMNSMPRNIAEYIQASSRVGREDLGLVVTLHNPFRTRDISHFERFKEFHEKMYCYIEPISITPFSHKAIDRYLALYLATIIRHTHPDLAKRDDANSLTINRAKTLKRDLIKYFEARKDRMKNDDISSIEKNILTNIHFSYIEDYINKSVDSWQDQIDNENQVLVYNNAKNKQRIPQKSLFISIDAYETGDDDNYWKVPMSLRTIDPEAVIKIEN